MEPEPNSSTIRKTSKKCWLRFYTKKCRREDFKESPRDTHDIVFKIMEEYQGCFTNEHQKNIQAYDGMVAMDDKLILRILQAHYHKVFN